MSVLLGDWGDFCFVIALDNSYAFIIISYFLCVAS